MSVPLLDLSAQYAPLRDEILAAVTRVCDSQRFILGPEVDALERELATRLEAEHAVAVSSGTDALLVALMAIGIGPGAEVITPTYSFFATAGTVRRLGATPVFVDIDPATFNVDPRAVARGDHAADARDSARASLRAVRPTWTPIGRGRTARRRFPSSRTRRRRSARASTDGRSARFGLAGCFSFFPSKNLGAFGDAGLVTTNDAALARELRLLRNHGAEPKYFHSRIGGNFRLDALQAAVLRVKAPHLGAWTDARRRNAARYRALFADAGLDGSVTLPVEPAGLHHIYNQFVIRGAEARRAARVPDARARSAPRSTTRCRSTARPASRATSAPGDRFPVADHAAATSLALPIYAELTEDQQRHVVSSIAEVLAPADERTGPGRRRARPAGRGDDAAVERPARSGRLGPR